MSVVSQGAVRREAEEVARTLRWPQEEQTDSPRCERRPQASPRRSNTARPAPWPLRSPRQRTALHLACANGHAEVVTVLLQRKCELNLRDNLERTPLIKAVQCQQEKCAHILLNHGADPNVSDIYGNTALHYAACGECVTTVAQLLSHNADIEANNEEGFTPLLLAIRQRKCEMTKYLLTKGANVHAVDKKKRTTLMLAIDNGSTVIARLLLQQDIDVFSEDTLGWTAENYAYKRGLNTICQLIDMYKVDKGIKNSSQNNRNSSPGSVSPGITVSDVSNQTPGELKTEEDRESTEEQDFIMMSKKERPDGSDYNHPQEGYGTTLLTCSQ
ncbi:POTE ankyrin domain family member A [Manis javanica]|nr:POTE ankyrin domain family member A [Manis javanica]